MVQSISGTQSSNTANDLIFNGTPSVGTADFAQQLLTAIEGLLQKSGSGSQFEIDIKPGQGQNSDGSQLTVTVKNLTPATVQPPSASQTQPITLMSSVTIRPNSSATSSTPASTTSPSALTADAKSNMSPDDAYWASQPPAVQALRNMPVDQRYTAAQELAIQGYTIDVPIMVNGMDPVATMIQRQIDGYTWVPSGLQANIPVGPGIMYPGQAYDPDNPPPGSIKVTTDFAAGTNMQNPWISKKQITDSMAGIIA